MLSLPMDAEPIAFGKEEGEGRRRFRRPAQTGPGEHGEAYMGAGDTPAAGAFPGKVGKTIKEFDAALASRTASRRPARPTS